MKKVLCMTTACSLTALTLFGCGVQEGGSTQESTYKAVLLVPALGDQSFYDTAAKGIDLANEELEGVTAKVIEMGSDESKWESAFMDAAMDYDLIIGGTWQSEPYLEKAAAEYPDKKFINFDYDTDPEIENIFTMFYDTNEIGWLSGVAAAAATISDMENANEDKVIGFIGSMDIPGINDFLVGYIEGAMYVDPDIQVLTGYCNSFYDAAKAKELALSQYNSGADVIYLGAATGSSGIVDAAKELGKYTIGVDTDQALLYEQTDEEKAKTIITSGIKALDTAIYQAIKNAKEGTLAFGTHEVYGFDTDGIYLAKNHIYEEVASDSVKEWVTKAEEDLKAGKVTVSSAFTMSQEEVESLRDLAQAAK
jgi:basic membrane protein A